MVMLAMVEALVLLQQKMCSVLAMKHLSQTVPLTLGLLVPTGGMLESSATHSHLARQLDTLAAVKAIATTLIKAVGVIQLVTSSMTAVIL